MLRAVGSNGEASGGRRGPSHCFALSLTQKLRFFLRFAKAPRDPTHVSCGLDI